MYNLYMKIKVACCESFPFNTANVFVHAESTILYAINGNHISFAKLIQGYHHSDDGGQYISTKTDGKKSIKLKLNEIAHQVLFFLVFCFILYSYLSV